jgi:hypothetical protein
MAGMLCFCMTNSARSSVRGRKREFLRRLEAGRLRFESRRRKGKEKATAEEMGLLVRALSAARLDVQGSKAAGRPETPPEERLTLALYLQTQT